MRIELDTSKDAKENASAYFEKAKKAKERLKGAEVALLQSKKELEALEKEEKSEEGKEKKEDYKIKRKKEWYEQFHFFFTPSGKLVIAGKSAKQNDLLYAKYLEENDLFFHADIQGAPATVLKGGKEADEVDKALTAQFSASYSSAWKVGVAAVDVYAVRKGQLSKHASGGFVGKGGFAIEGEREWFRKTPLGLKVFAREGVPFAVPERMQVKEKAVVLEVGGKDEKVKAAKKIAKLLLCELDELMQLLPSGGMRVVWGS